MKKTKKDTTEQKLIGLLKMHAVYVRVPDFDWWLFSAEPNLEWAKATADMLEVTHPTFDCCIIPPTNP
jgi:hypothetical protein